MAVRLALNRLLSDGLMDNDPMIRQVAAISVGLILPGLYLGSLVTRTLIGRRPVRFFGMMQTAAALLIGIGGAWKVSTFSGTSTTAISVMILLLGTTTYAAAFAFVDRQTGRGRPRLSST